MPRKTDWKMMFKLTLINGQEVSVYNLDQCGMCGSKDLSIDRVPYYEDLPYSPYWSFPVPRFRTPRFEDLTFACHQCGYKQIFRYEKLS